MKKIFSVLIIPTLFYSCGNSNQLTNNNKEVRSNYTENDVVSNQTISKNTSAFEDNLKDFNNCKINEPGKGKCKEYLAKAVCEYYGIEDLKDGSNYVKYDKIPEKLKKLGSWKNIGAFNDENLKKALNCLNSLGNPVLIFNEDDSYVHVVALKPNGKLFKSGKWGNISVPSCVSYFPRRKDSFSGKGINYAFKSAKNLTIWTKK
tara:strand:- start:143 stop:754 length:612 start_codon:yes stop_codon:yes gene_type:complete